ncbi:MAG: glycosyltransferase family 2 protein [Candidatus Yanofskybacteria bacterium]|nr:glycosyltransferase family 2 protein [Candidatus Yanofskybacteria bacterium]
MFLTVIIPAYNEEKHIKSTIQSIYGYLSDKKIEHEIIVVTDGSKDQTNNIVGSMLSAIPTLQLLDYELNRGKGFAVRQGMLKAKGQYRLFTDADNATSIDHIEKMLPYFNQGYDVVIASVTVKGGVVASGSEPIWRRLFGTMGNLFIQSVAVPGISDTQRGFKIVTAKAAQDIFSRTVIDRWGFDIEMLALARKLGYKIKEVPVTWKNDPNTASHPRLPAYFQVLMETVKIRWNLITGKYN